MNEHELLVARFDALKSWLENWSEAAARDVSTRYGVMNRVYTALGQRAIAKVEGRWSAGKTPGFVPRAEAATPSSSAAAPS